MTLSMKYASTSPGRTVARQLPKKTEAPRRCLCFFAPSGLRTRTMPGKSYLTEILQNALVHRSWLKPAPIRILIFDNRVEIISPGALPPTLTVEDIKLGNAFQRNQLVATLCAKTMNYRGLGSGIIRALNADPNIEFHNEVSVDQFRVILWRDTVETQNPVKNYPENPESTKSKEKNYPENNNPVKSKEKNYPENNNPVKSKEKNYPENNNHAKSKE
ncbi:MAG: hypothetical protein K2K97_06945, partial [Muribaculaceae bacterium]|nr:hypothetical protein [Muribaculaceae bacterium]